MFPFFAAAQYHVDKTCRDHIKFDWRVRPPYNVGIGENDPRCIRLWDQAAMRHVEVGGNCRIYSVDAALQPLRAPHLKE